MTEARPEGRYANLFTVGYNAFEFVVDCAQLFPEHPEPHVHSRIVTSPPYAKLLLETLRESLARYEQIYGAIPGPERGAGGEARTAESPPAVPAADDDGRTTMPERPEDPKPGDYTRPPEPPRYGHPGPERPADPGDGYGQKPPLPEPPPGPPPAPTPPYTPPDPGRPYRDAKPEEPGHEHPGHEHPGHEHPQQPYTPPSTDPYRPRPQDPAYGGETPTGYGAPPDTRYPPAPPYLPPPKSGYERPETPTYPPEGGYPPQRPGHELPPPKPGYEQPKPGYRQPETPGYQPTPGYQQEIPQHPYGTPAPEGKPCPKPEEQLKELQKTLDTQNSQIQTLEKQRKSLEEDLTGLKQTVDELAKILAAYKEACKKLKQQKADLEETVKTKTPMVEAGVGNKKPLIEQCIQGVDQWIESWRRYAEYLEPKAKAAADAATRAADAATAAQTSYDDLKNSAKTLDDQLKALATLRDQIEAEDDKNKVCRMYFLLKELRAGLDGVNLRTLEELERELCLSWTELSKAKEAARAAKTAADAARAAADRAKTKAADAKAMRRDYILECVDKVCPPPPPANGCC
jgi:hypothetical protein